MHSPTIVEGKQTTNKQKGQQNEKKSHTQYFPFAQFIE